MKLKLKTKKILLIEDYAVMRKTIREMLYALEAHAIVEAENGTAAITAMGKTRFNIVLCDYNLGPGKNGLQILEEARFRKLLPFNAIFIMVTAEQDPGMVLGAMENKPDDYLTKPFTAQQLYSRLERHIQRKKVLANIERELERGNLALAIFYCDKLLQTNGKKMRTQLMKLRAELAITVSDFSAAKTIYEEILEQREINWARLGLGKIFLLQGEIPDATQTFQNVIAENPMMMEAYDWLARTYEAADESADAQEILHAAVDLSPQAILRQKHLAVIAERNGNTDVAKNAYETVIKLGKNSVFKAPADFSGLAKIHHKTGTEIEALKVLDNMRQAFPNDPEAELRSATLETEIYLKINEKELSEQAYRRAFELHTKMANLVPKDLNIDMAKACYINDDADKADAILNNLVKNNIDDDEFIAEIKAMHQSLGMDNHADSLIKKTRQTLVDINNRGVSLFKQGDLQQAINLLEKAIEKMPDNKTIILNMLKILLHDSKANGSSLKKLAQIQHYIDRAVKLGSAREKIGNIRMEFNKLLLNHNAKTSAHD